MIAVIVAAIAFIIYQCIILKELYCKHEDEKRDIDIDTYTDLYGREETNSTLMKYILSNKHLVIEIVGIVGIGKTVFVLNTTETLVKSHGYNRIYIDMSEYEGIEVNVTSVMISNFMKAECTQRNFISSLFLSLKAQYSQNSDTLLYWYNQLQPNTIVILDHVHNLTVLDEIERKIIEPLSKLKFKSVVFLNVLRISKREYLHRPVIKLPGLDTAACASWISSKYKHEQVSFTHGEQLCHELGGAPSDVLDVIALTSHELTSYSNDEVIAKLRSEKYGEVYEYLESILGRHYKDTSERNTAMYIHYNRLTYEQRKCIWLLVEMTQHGEFTKKMAEQHLEHNVDDCLDALLMNSLLEMTTIKEPPHKIFRFRENVKKFVQYIGQPTPDVKEVRNEVWVFYGNYVKYNVRRMHSRLREFRDVKLAISIGSNRGLVNSLLPLLGDNYELRPLFKMALEVIVEHYCSARTANHSSSASALLSFSYLTKAVHCPFIHAPEMISSRKKLPIEPSKCLNKLQSCPAILSMNRNSYEAAEALGYHNALLIYASDKVLPTVPWSFVYGRSLNDCHCCKP